MVAVLWRCRCDRLFLGGVGSGAVWPHGCCGHRSRDLLARWAGCLKPRSPLRLLAEPRLKPPSPLRARNGCFWCSFWAQRRCRFQGSPVGGEQWCCWFQRRRVVVPCARKSSPCSAWCGCEREKVRPARSKWPKIGVFWHAGRVFSRKRGWSGRAGRVFSRQPTLRRSWMQRRAPPAGCGGGFALHESL